MDINLEQANKDVNEVYSQLNEAVKEVTAEITKPLDDIIKELSKGVNLFSNSELWDFQLRLGLESYRLSIVKEQSSLKDACAQALYKEGLARSFSETSGAVELKKQTSILATADKQAVSILYTSISNLLKTKLDEVHRLVNIIQNIQISRAAEAKQNGSPRSETDKISFNTESGESQF